MVIEDGTSLFEIIDFQGQTFRAILSSADVYSINGVTNPLVITARAKKPAKKPTKPTENPNKTTIVIIRLIYKLIEI